MNEVAKVQTITPSDPFTSAPLTPMQMIERAVTSGAGIEVIERLMTLQERWDAHQARKAFDAAVASAKAEIPIILKNRTVSYGQGKAQFRHEDMAEIARTVDPILAKHGLSYRFRCQSDDRVAVTCILSHREGHSEENTLRGPPDSSGAKNAIQAIGSSVTYLERYTLKAALGLAASDDDDARAAGDETPISAEQATKLRTIADEVGADVAKFCKYLKVESIAAIPASRFTDALNALEGKRKS